MSMSGAPKLETLQMLRGLAAFLIMAKHALYEVDANTNLAFHYGDYKFYTVGIDIFFVLSGFIMVYTCWGREGPAAALEFMTRRIVRIVPLYWFYTFALLLVAFFIPQVLAKAEFVPIDFLKSLLFIPYMNTAGDIQPFLANGWSLNYEMYFYAIFAVCLALPARISLYVMAVYFLLSVFTNFWFMPESLTSIFYGKNIVLEFLAGAVIGVLFKRNIRLPRLFFWVGLTFLAGAVVILPFTQFLADLGFTYNKPLVGVLAVALLILPHGAEYIRMPRPSVLMGDSSYTLYLAHPFALGAVTQIIVLAKLNDIISPWITFGLCAVVSVIGSYIAYLVIERPMTNYLRKQAVLKPGKPASHLSYHSISEVRHSHESGKL